MGRKKVLKDINETISSLEEKRIDLRTSKGKHLRQVKSAVTADLDAASVAILKNDLACNIVIQREIMDYLFKNGSVSATGELANNLARFQTTLQSSNRSIIKLLREVEAEKSKKQPDPGARSKDPGRLILDVISSDIEADDDDD